MAKKVFISYARKDKKTMDEFKTFLVGLKRERLINIWQDRQIKLGEEWDPAIKKALHSADIIIFLVTQNFISSNYIFDIEIKVAMERYEIDETIIIPIIISNCDFNSSPLKKFQALPTDAKPISQWETREDGWMDVVNQLRTFLDRNDEAKTLSSREMIKDKIKKELVNSPETLRIDNQNETIDQTSSIRNLILTADHFGACDFIDRGIEKAIDEGVITCITAFINFKERKAGEPGGKYVGSVKALKALRRRRPSFPIGLHLTINSGSPVAKDNLIPNLIQAGHFGKRNFKNIYDFKPMVYFTPHIVQEIGREVRAQLQKYRNIFDEDPSHISSHFGILFIFKNLLEEILGEGGISGIPVRNPILTFQTPDKENARNSSKLKASKKFFKEHSKMRDTGQKKAMKWIADSMSSAMGVIFQGATVKSRMKLLMQHNCHFPDYTMDYFYKRGPTDPTDWEGGLAKFIRMIPPFIPQFYSKNQDRVDGVVAEIICHLGDGAIPASAPAGIDIGYFGGRQTELNRLIGAKPVLRTNSLNLVDFDFLDDSAFA